MKKLTPVLVLFSLTVSALLVFCLPTAAQKIEYPKTKKIDQTDTYFNVQVADPYRWLENENAPETTSWVNEQNKVTFGYLEKIPFRQQIKQRLEKIYNYPKYTAPYRKGEYYIFSKNDGLQNQNVLYIQKGLNGKPEVLLDPNKFSADGTSRLAGFSLSKDGKYAVYGISKGGSDWQEYYVMEVATRKQLADVLKWVKVSGMAWQNDGFYYSRYDAPEAGKELTTKNENHKVYFHKVGTPQSADV
jgi:prolyl oligopeptidase